MSEEDNLIQDDGDNDNADSTVHEIEEEDIFTDERSLLKQLTIKTSQEEKMNHNRNQKSQHHQDHVQLVN